LKANPNSWEAHRVRKRWDTGLLRALSPRIMMMMMMMNFIWVAIFRNAHHSIKLAYDSSVCLR